MLGKSQSQAQKNMFVPLLAEFIDPTHPLVQLAERMPWSELEQEFAQYYSHTGKPSMPVRLMAGLLLLKQMYNLGDETVMSAWVQNPYFQYFCGMAEFQWKMPCDPSDLVHFRKRIGSSGAEKLLELSLRIQNKDSRSSDVIIDTTVQEKNITYPSDSKLYMGIIKKCRDIALREGVVLRRSYTRTVKQLMQMLHFGRQGSRSKQAVKARKQFKTIAARVKRDLLRKLSQELLERYAKDFAIFDRVLQQQQKDKNKVYSLHEPDVSCIAKGKSHKPFEFGSKVSIAIIPHSNLIVGVRVFQGNPYDGHTLESALQQVERLTGRSYNNAIVDRGYRGIDTVGSTRVIRPEARPTKSRSQRKHLRKKCRSRSAIEPIIGHLKHDYGMLRNYLKGTVGDEFNAMMAGAAFNFKRWMRKLASTAPSFLFLLLRLLKTDYNLTTTHRVTTAQS